MTAFLTDPKYRPSGVSLLSDYRFRRLLQHRPRLPLRRDGERPRRQHRMPELFVPPRQPSYGTARGFRLSARRRPFGRDNVLDRLEGEAWLRRMYAEEDRLGSFQGRGRNSPHAEDHPIDRDASD